MKNYQDVLDDVHFCTITCPLISLFNVQATIYKRTVYISLLRDERDVARCVLLTERHIIVASGADANSLEWFN